MRKLNGIRLIAGLLIVSAIASAQIDTTRREFWPLGLGNLWQYRDEYGHVSRTTWVSIADTVLPNGAHYAALGRAPYYVFDRIDSSLRVQWYALWAGDSSCGGSVPQEASVYRLGEDSGKVWKDCYNWNGFLGLPLVRCVGMRPLWVFGQWREEMVFQHGYVTPETGDTVWGSEGDRLARGIGLMWRGFWYRAGYEYLAGAIINGDTLGIVVSVLESPKQLPVMTTLYQNYPNPFNSSTTIQYELPEQSHVRLTVHDILGRKVASLVEQMQSAGRYRVRFDAADLASGVYLYMLRTGNSITPRRMIILK